jgi:creatinine amidohydrolase/Fe(II)-dependent formamide hydrolase-like protein
MGKPQYATPEKGESLLKAITGEVVACIKDFETW